jgi:transposase
VTLDQIDDIELLRKAALLLQEDNKKLVRLIAKMKKELHALRGGDPEQLKLAIADLEQQLAKRNQMLFGDKSEKRPGAKEPKAEKAPKTGHGPRQQLLLPEIEQVHLLDQADQVCSSCGGGLELWEGQHEASEEVDVVELKYVLKKHLRQKYRCRCGACIETAPGPQKLFAGARYSIDFALSVAIAKYADHLPLERQVKMMDRHGLIADSQTLWDQIDALAKVLGPTYSALSAYVLNQPVIGADETTWRLMGGSGKKNGGDKKWQVWTAAAPDAVFYQIQDSRSTEAARNLLGHYAGTVVCDDYSAYKSLRKRGGQFQLAHCWAHVRRKFIDAEAEAPKECAEAIAMIAELYGVEKRANTGPPEERARLRNDESRAIVKRIEQWVLTSRTLPGSGLRKAIEYMGHMWNEGLLRFLDDPNVPIDNNGTERCLRGVVLGRKNHYGSRSQRGTEVAALLYSLIESAKLAGVGPNTYLRAATMAALRGEPALLPHQLA